VPLKYSRILGLFLPMGSGRPPGDGEEARGKTRNRWPPGNRPGAGYTGSRETVRSYQQARSRWTTSMREAARSARASWAISPRAVVVEIGQLHSSLSL